MTISPASAMARLRWSSMSAEEKRAHMQKMTKARKKQAKQVRKLKQGTNP